MIVRTVLVVGVTLGLAALCRAEMPYPPNPRPCEAPNSPPECIAPTDFAHYLFLPTTVPPTLPNDFGTDNWKLTSERTGEPDIDSNPQELSGVKGASVDLAWQVTTGRPDVIIAVLDSGIEWQHALPDLVDKIYLNRGELPIPENSSNQSDPWDRNGDGVFNVADYLADGAHQTDSRIADQNGNGVVDPEDLIFTFSDGRDDDGNGYVDDVAGWDFFEDDNDPLDEVGYGHGTGEAEDSNAEANNGSSDVGSCPSCMVMPVRVGDSFVAEVNNFAQGVLFATDSGARVIQEALGSLNNSSFAQAAIDYAYRRGIIVVASAADEESNHHNYPANYNHTLEVNSVTKFDDTAGLQQTPRSYLYLNGCTNFGAHIAVSVPSSSCSSEATGKGAGIAGLVNAAALNAIERGTLTPYPNDDGSIAAFPLSANEVKQLLTMTADDINFDARPDAQPPLEQNYATTSPFPGVQMSERFHSVAGWDQYFGYGRINANTAVRRVAAGTIPPEASIDLPAWFQVISPDAGTLTLSGRVAANRAASYSYTVEVAPGIQPAERDFVVVEQQSARTAALAGTLATISLSELAARMPRGVEGRSFDATGHPDPDRFTFTVRVRVVDDHGNRAEDRRTYFLHRDPQLVGGVPLSLGSDGVASPVLADVDGDGVEDIVLATSDGYVHAFAGDAHGEFSGWPVHTDPIEVHGQASAFTSQEVPQTPYVAILGSPAVGDLDQDGYPEIVAADIQGKLYAWRHDGALLAGFPVSTASEYSNSRRSERDMSTAEGRVPDRTNRHSEDNRVQRGFGAGPTLGNLDGSPDGSLEIIAGANDRHVYAWHADGTLVHGWPALIKDPSKVQSIDPITNEVTLTPSAKADIGTKIITPPSLGDIDGDGTLDVVVGVNEEYGERPNAVFNNLTISLYRASGILDSGNGRVYALFHDGTAHGGAGIDRGWNPDAFMPGWPVKIAMLTQDLLPTVGTGINGPPALADLDRNGTVEVAVFSFLGPAYVLNGLGESFLGDAQPGVPRTLEADALGSESPSNDAPAYPALGGGVLAEMAGPEGGFQFVAPTAGLGKLIDGNLAAHQTPSDNQLAIWDVANPDGTVGSGTFRSAFPRLMSDLQFLTTPAVADIDGDGLPEALAGSGVYDLHAINIDGTEPPGWPKLTGGWTIATPAVGDIDGDGRSEVVAVTREGLLFIWKTGTDECSRAPWPQYHHDEWSTGNYQTDARPPAPILPQTATLSGGVDGAVTLALAAVPGDNLYCGEPARLDIRYAPQPITTQVEFSAATRFDLLSQPLVSGRHQHATLLLQGARPFIPGPAYVAGRSLDAAGNVSPVTALGEISFEAATPTLTATATRTASATATPIPTSSPTPESTATSRPAPTATPTASSLHTSGGCALDPHAPRAYTAWWSVMLLLSVRAARRRRS